MKIFLPAIASLAFGPQVTAAWSCGPRYYGLDVWSPRVLQKQHALLQKQQSLLQKAFTHTSPRYEITDTDEKFQLSIDVPGVKPEDIQVNFEDDGSMLSIRGSRAVTSSDESSSFRSKFSQSFSIDPSVDVKNFSASLKNGVLVISAPKDLKKIEDNIRNIPITEAPDEDVAPVEMKDETVEKTSPKSLEHENTEDVGKPE